MANNIHFEARRRQMFIDRQAKAKKEASLTIDQSGICPSAQNAHKSEPIMCTDQGQFYQTRTCQNEAMSRQILPSDVVFEKVVHDPNFYYRASKERRLEPPLHVNEIYPILYPGATVKVENCGKR